VVSDGNASEVIGSFEANNGTQSLDLGYYYIKQRGGNHLSFDVGSAERMRIDSSGNVGVGTASPNSYSGYTTVTLNGGTNGSVFDFERSGTIEGEIVATANAFGVGAVAASGVLTFRSGGNVERMRMDSSGNVGVGTSSPSAFASYKYLDVAGSSSSQGGVIQVYTSGKETRAQWFADSTGVTLAGVTNHHFKFATNATERMRIDSSGRLLLGKTSNSNSTAGTTLYGNGKIEGVRDGGSVHQMNRLTSDGSILDFQKDGTTVGSIGSQGGLYCYMGSSSNTDAYTAWADGNFKPSTSTGTNNDNAMNLGNVSARWDDIYATNGTIQTSDRNEKQDIAELTDAEQRVAVAAKGLLRKFRWKDKVAEKGDKARTHFGIIAQDLQAAFAAEGLDASDYAMFISTTWTDEETGEERTRMGVRYSELLAFIIAAI
jgi:hypothetical protein